MSVVSPPPSPAPHDLEQLCHHRSSKVIFLTSFGVFLCESFLCAQFMVILSYNTSTPTILGILNIFLVIRLRLLAKYVKTISYSKVVGRTVLWRGNCSDYDVKDD